MKLLIKSKKNFAIVVMDQILTMSHKYFTEHRPKDFWNATASNRCGWKLLKDIGLN